MFGRVFAKNTSLETKFPSPKNTSRKTKNLVSRLVFFANTPPEHDIFV